MRTVQLFQHLMEYLRMCDEELYQFYMGEVTDDKGDIYPELITSALLMEAECSVKNCIM